MSLGAVIQSLLWFPNVLSSQIMSSSLSESSISESESGLPVIALFVIIAGVGVVMDRGGGDIHNLYI